MRREFLPEQERVARAWIPYLILAVALLLTAVASHTVARQAETKGRLQFESVVRETRDDIDARLDNYVALLRSASGLFAAGGEVGRQEFRSYVEQLRLREQYQGIQGIGF